jgi:predicted nucleic acid-binding protein
LNVVDSSGWLEYFTNESNAAYFAPIIEDTRNLIVPTICLLEVFKKIFRDQGKVPAVERIAYMKLGEVVPLDESLALEGAVVGLEHKLPMADSIILATARRFNAVLWTQDDDFQGIANIQYRAKKRQK